MVISQKFLKKFSSKRDIKNLTDTVMNKLKKIPRRKRKSFYTNSYSKIRVKEDLIADKLQVSLKYFKLEREGLL